MSSGYDQWPVGDDNMTEDWDWVGDDGLTETQRKIREQEDTEDHAPVA